MKIIAQFGREYVLVGSAAECRQLLAAGISIEDVGTYGIKAVKGKPNKLYTDNLRKLAQMPKHRKKRHARSR